MGAQQEVGIVSGLLCVDSLHLKNIARFDDIQLRFQPGMNYLCGTNGIGKTTILEAIASAFVRSNYITIRKKVSASLPGVIQVGGHSDGQPISAEGQIAEFVLEAGSQPFGFNGLSPYVLNIKTSRDFSYSRTHHLQADPDRRDHDAQQQALNGLPSGDIKLWFANRWLFRGERERWPEHKYDNLIAAITSFSLIDKSVRLSHVDSSNFDIMVETPSGIIPFELLSSGYRASFSIILGILKEIEYRKLDVRGADFGGLILIDELDLHLHPTWQREIGRILKAAFPCAQIIATTHSPHIIQSAEKGEVIAIIDGDNGPCVNEVGYGEYGFRGWTIEEILRDVMGLDEVVTEEYRTAMRKFDDAVDAGDGESANSALTVLEAMLHPNNHLRKLLRLQAAKM